jgi:hypothetical protein
MGDPVNPDHSEGTGEGAQAASGALLFIKDHQLTISMKGSRQADRGAASRFALMAEDRNGCQVLYVMHIEPSLALMHYLAGCLAGATANALSYIDVNRHFIPPGFSAWKLLAHGGWEMDFLIRKS